MAEEQKEKGLMCGNCLYWKTHEESELGECHRYAPRPADASLAKNVVWPFTMADNFCGEFQVREFKVEAQAF